MSAGRTALTESTKLTGVILAGGMNRRMGGRRKAMLKLGGRTFLELQLEAMAPLCRERILVTNEPEAYDGVLKLVEGDVRVIPDVRPGCGPLSGLQAAMRAATGELLLIVGCDMPCISERAAIELVRLRGEGDHEAAVARIGGRLHPLHGVYHRRCLPQVEAMLTEGEHRFMRLFDRISWRSADDGVFEREGIGIDYVNNVNDPAEYDRLVKQLKSLLGVSADQCKI